MLRGKADDGEALYRSGSLQKSKDYMSYTYSQLKNVSRVRANKSLIAVGMLFGRCMWTPPSSKTYVGLRCLLFL